MRLSASNLAALPQHVARPAYDRNARNIGIVHFGIGAFHRAHMAVYTDDAMNAAKGDWGILGISLRSPAVAERLNPQDGLYTLTERSAAGSQTRLIGAVKKAVVAHQEPETVVVTLAAPTTHIVSFTITEKGYCRAPDGSLDLNLCNEVSIYTFLAAGFRRRMEAGLPGLTLLSCDNLAGNGVQLKRLMTEYLVHNAPDLIAWFASNCTCPSTMVDRIVPAMTGADLTEIATATGMQDQAAVITEPFSQWVIEDNFAGPRPAWEQHHVQIASDVRPFETAKLRMLNGAHSALAYLGLQRGHEFVHQAIADRELRPLIDQLMRQEAASSLSPAPGQNLDAYADALINRFANPALGHRLVQIAMDGSQKIPQRWLETLAFHQQRGVLCPALLKALAAWIGHLRNDRNLVNDPQQQTLYNLLDRHRGNDCVSAFFGPESPLPKTWHPSPADREILNAALGHAV